MASVERRLVLLRHAKATSPEGVADVDRPLATQGKHDSPVAGQWLAEHLPVIDIAVCSTAARARQTWNLVAAELDHAPLFQPDDRLYGASAEQLLAVIRMLPDEARTALVVGHNPGIEELVHLLTGTPQALSTCAIAVLTCPDNWASTAARAASLATTTTPRAERGPDSG